MADAFLRVLGLDIKPSRSGIARTYDAEGDRHLSVTAIDSTLRPLDEQVDRLEWILTRPSLPRPDVAVIEGTFTRGGGSDYGQIVSHFIVCRTLRRRRVPIVEIQPTTLKLWAAGHGKATKRDVCAAVVAAYGRLMNINPDDDDACDAVALMALGCAAYGQPLADLTPQQRKQLAGQHRVGKWPTLTRE
jgi:crossover junction endodeoxyribonuclease RuvC